MKSNLEILLAHAIISITPVMGLMNLAKYIGYNKTYTAEENISIATSCLFGYAVSGVFARLKPPKR